MLLGQLREDAAQRRDILLDDPQCLAHLEHDRRVHDVLGRGAPMHVAARLAALLHELMDQRQDRIADDVGLVPQPVEVERVEIASGGDLLGGLGRDHAAARLGLRQRDLGLDVAADQRVVGEHGPHRAGAEGVAEQDGSQERWSRWERWCPAWMSSLWNFLSPDHIYVRT